MEGIRIEECVELSRWLNAEIEQIEENFSLEVSSPGLGSAFVVPQQYEKNVGREVEIIFLDGSKKKGLLKEVKDGSILVEIGEKKLAGGSQKKKKLVLEDKTFELKDIKSTKVVIKF